MHFTPRLFAFLRDLTGNNNRDWFNENKPRYIEHVRDPMLRFIEDFEPKLHAISPHFIADSSLVGGSMFRIHRDTRFAKDKSPYKTAASAQFRHERARDVHAPGFYLHLAPGEVFVGTGLWHPDAPTLKKIRDRIADDPKAWQRLLRSRPFKDGLLTLEGDRLKRPPRGYDAEHPCIEDLKRKDFVTVAKLTQKDVCAPDFLKRFTNECRTATPFMKYLTEAADLDW